MTEHTVEELKDNVAKATKALAEAEASAAFQEFPKHITPHGSHIVTTAGGHMSAPHFKGLHVDREGVLTVLVHDAAEEAKALAAAATEAK